MKNIKKKVKNVKNKLVKKMIDEGINIIAKRIQIYKSRKLQKS